MDSIETFVTNLILKALHRAAPNLSPDDDAKITKAVQEFVTTAVDLAAVCIAVRKARK
jgi:hypothetical protein